MSRTTMKRFWCMRHLWILLAMPLAAGTARIYVSNTAGTTIDVIDAATNKVVEVIKDIESPEAARFSPDGSRVYITSSGENVLDVMDRISGKHIKKVPLSGYSNDLAVTNDGRLVLVNIREASQNTGALDIIDASSLEKVKTIPLKAGLHDIVATQDSKYAAAGSVEGHTLTVFDLQSMKIAWEVHYDEGVLPLAIDSNPDGSGRRIFLQLNHTHGFTVVNFATHAEVARIKLPDEPSGFSSDKHSHGIAIAPDGKTLWVNSWPANAVFVYSLPEIKLLGHVSLPELDMPGKAPRGSEPNWITFTPDSKTVYVSTCGTKSITAIDVQAIKEVTRIPVHEMPDRISTLVLR